MKPAWPRWKSRHLRASLWFLATVCAADAAFADSTAPDREAQFARAHEAIEAKHFVEARRLLMDLWKKEETHDVAANLGHVEYQLENYAAAVRFTAFALENTPPKEGTEVLEQLRMDLEEAKKHVATIVISADQPSAEVRVDGKFAGSTPLASPVYLNPGAHAIEARLGRLQAKKSLLVAAGRFYDVELRLGISDTEPSTSPPGTENPVSSTPRRDAVAGKPVWPYWLSGAVAAVGLGFGVGFSLAAKDKEDRVRDIQDHLDAQGWTNPCAGMQFSEECVELNTAIDAHHRNRDIALAGFITAGVGAAGLIAYWMVPEGTFRKSGVVVGPQHAVVTVGGAF